MLLALEGVHLHRQLGRADHVFQVDEAPALHLGAEAKVEVFGEGVVLPAPRVNDRGAAPHARGTVEVEEAARAIAPAVLEDEVPVEHDRLHLGEQGVVAVDVAPAGLHHPHLRIGKLPHRLLENIGRGHEVGVEDEDQLALGHREPRGEGSCLEAGAVFTMDVLHVEATLFVGQDRAPG